jgi:hypothetical protein
MRKSWIAAGFTLMLAACVDRSLPDASPSIAGPTPVAATPSLPTTVPGVLALSMPIDQGNSSNAAFGIAPFGYHGPVHAEDGHPGWEIEYRAGASVRAAAAGTIESVIVDPFGRFTVQIEHVVGAHVYRTTYTNLVALAADIAESEVVGAGQPLGTPGGTTHFQLDDFEYYRDMSNPNAVSPEPFLTPAAKSLFDDLWSRAFLVAELVEPYPTNPRVMAFPLARTWTRAGGDGPAGIRFTRLAAKTADYTYALLAESGTVVETGTVAFDPAARPFSAIDLVSPTSLRRGVYNIVSNEMKLSLADAGAVRPMDLGSASVYRTK